MKQVEVRLDVADQAARVLSGLNASDRALVDETLSRYVASLSARGFEHGGRYELLLLADAYRLVCEVHSEPPVVRLVSVTRSLF